MGLNNEAGEKRDSWQSCVAGAIGTTNEADVFAETEPHDFALVVDS